MSLKVCPIQEVCPKYENGTKDNTHYTRLYHPCNRFLATDCEMSVQLEMFLVGPIACELKKREE